MRDGMEGPVWAQHHQAFSDNVGSLFEALRDSLRRLHAIQFDAPWKHDGIGSGRPGQA